MNVLEHPRKHWKSESRRKDWHLPHAPGASRRAARLKSSPRKFTLGRSNAQARGHPPGYQVGFPDLCVRWGHLVQEHEHENEEHSASKPSKRIKATSCYTCGLCVAHNDNFIITAVTVPVTYPGPRSVTLSTPTSSKALLTIAAAGVVSIGSIADIAGTSTIALRIHIAPRPPPRSTASLDPQLATKTVEDDDIRARAFRRLHTIVPTPSTKLEQLRKALPLGCAVLPPRSLRTPEPFVFDPAEPPKRGRPRGVKSEPASSKRLVTNLDPANLTEGNYISLKKPARNMAVNFLRADEGDTLCSIPCTPHESTVFPVGPFPADTSGFFYYYKGTGPTPLHAVLHSGLRFRLTPTPDPASFPLGTDLLTPLGLPWCLPLWALAVTPTRFRPLFAHLTAEGLLPPSPSSPIHDELLPALAAAVPANRVLDPAFVLSAPLQDFPLRCHPHALRELRILVPRAGLDTSTVCAPRLRTPFRAFVAKKGKKRKGELIYPWASGVAHAHFVRSADPFHRAARKRILRLRCTRVLEPGVLLPGFDEHTYTHPTPGALVLTGPANAAQAAQWEEDGKGPQRPWEVDVDGPLEGGTIADRHNRAAALAALWDMSRAI
ncbi:hypothetical protein C8R46DRAFT_1344456 [Mycena filopes]|nr:hypothetical protein C8R46DRAFT_1344456 [Mycena filopes]